MQISGLPEKRTTLWNLWGDNVLDLSPIISKPVSGSAGKTGDWRLKKPVVDSKLCSLCGNCIVYCPEGVIERGDESVTVDYGYCKGCGVCSRICERGAIKMV